MVRYTLFLVWELLQVYEDASLEYIGINEHKGDDIGLHDTVISPDDLY